MLGGRLRGEKGMRTRVKEGARKRRFKRYEVTRSSDKKRKI